MKLTSTIIALTILPTVAFAASSPPSDNFNGFYAGVQGGYEMFKSTDNFTGTGALAGDTESSSAGFDGGNLGLFAGYGQRINRDFYLGAEIEGDLASAEVTSRVTIGATTASATVKHENDYGASIRAGFFPTTNTLLYGRLGAVESNFNDGNSISLTGIRAGIGTETAISSNMTLRADWVYTGYESYTFMTSAGNFSYTPDSSTFRVGLAYSF